MPWSPLGVGLVMAAGTARAGDDEDEDDKTFEEKIIEDIMTGIGGTNMENQGIEYRERSPLVVPPKLDLPPPAGAAAEVKAPNWPKDPDEERRKAAIAARKKANKDPREASRALTPDELSGGKAPNRSSGDIGSDQPGGNPAPTPILSPSQLGYNGSLGGLFGGNKTETAPFKGEPTRDIADPAAARLPDAVAEFCLRHRPEGIAEQGIQSGRRQVWRIA